MRQTKKDRQKSVSAGYHTHIYDETLGIKNGQLHSIIDKNEIFPYDPSTFPASPANGSSTVAKPAVRQSSTTAPDTLASAPIIANVIACRPASTTSSTSFNPADITTKAPSATTTSVGASSTAISAATPTSATTFADAAAVFLSTQHPAISNEVIKEYKSNGYAQSILAVLSNAGADSRYSLANGLIIINNRLYVPAKLRPRVADLLHQALDDALAPAYCSGDSDAEKKPKIRVA
uniref:Uncharacterized protein n=1 Tax=Panagrolaimus davidi TaxID=227884 RepID=A0A914QP13_9BILA